MLCIGTRHSQFCETSVKITEWVTDPLRVSVTFVKSLLLEGGNFDVSPNRFIHLMLYIVTMMMVNQNINSPIL